MKSIFTVIILFAITLIANAHSSITIKGNTKNANGTFITLSHQPRMRGNLNFDNFKSTGTQISTRGTFTIKSGNITDGAIYNISVNNNFISLPLFTSDAFTVYFDGNDPHGTFFATGRGAGKINILRLEQFKYLAYKSDWTPEEFVTKTDSTITAQLQLLDAVYAKNTNDLAIVSAKNRAVLERIIKESPLSEKELSFLKNRVELLKFHLIDFISQVCETEKYASQNVDFNSTIFKAFTPHEYSQITNLNAWNTEEALDFILKYEYLKSTFPNNSLTYKDWNSSIKWDDYLTWMRANLKTKFNPEVCDQYFSNQAASYMTMGIDASDNINYLKENSINNKYITRITGFKNALDYGLQNKKYGLGAEHQTLDEAKFATLLKKYQNRNVIIIFWSAEYAGAYILDNISAVNNFKKNNDIEVVNICIDKQANKNLWAARIIDSSWKGNHYFMPVETNANTLKQFSSDKIEAFCYGGVTFTIISKSGTIHNKVEKPLEMSKAELSDYIE
jgi:hypothetical protein